MPPGEKDSLLYPAVSYFFSDDRLYTTDSPGGLVALRQPTPSKDPPALSPCERILPLAVRWVVFSPSPVLYHRFPFPDYFLFPAQRSSGRFVAMLTSHQMGL